MLFQRIKILQSLSPFSWCSKLGHFRVWEFECIYIRREHKPSLKPSPLHFYFQRLSSPSRLVRCFSLLASAILTVSIYWWQCSGMRVPLGCWVLNVKCLWIWHAVSQDQSRGLSPSGWHHWNTTLDGAGSYWLHICACVCVCVWEWRPLQMFSISACFRMMDFLVTPSTPLPQFLSAVGTGNGFLAHFSSCAVLASGTHTTPCVCV